MYQKRSASKKSAADAEPNINMDEKEATPVEDIEEILPPMEPDRPVQTEEEKFRETMMKMVEQLGQKTDNSYKNLKEFLI